MLLVKMIKVVKTMTNYKPTQFVKNTIYLFVLRVETSICSVFTGMSINFFAHIYTPLSPIIRGNRGLRPLNHLPLTAEGPTRCYLNINKKFLKQKVLKVALNGM